MCAASVALRGSGTESRTAGRSSSSSSGGNGKGGGNGNGFGVTRGGLAELNEDQQVRF